MTASRSHKKHSTEPRVILEDFLDQICLAHGTQLEEVTPDIVGFRTTPSLEKIVADREMFEFPLILAQAVDPHAEKSSCRDLSQLIESALEDGDFCNVTCAPLVAKRTAVAAATRAAGAGLQKRKGKDSSAGFHRSFGMLSFRVAYRHLQEEVVHATFIFDLETGQEADEMKPLLHHLHPWKMVDSDLPPDGRQALEMAHDGALAQVTEIAGKRMAEISGWLSEQDQARRDVMETYFNELEKELEEEKRSVYYHLYFFEKEREIEEKIRRIENERQQRNGPKTPPVVPDWKATLVNVGVFVVPFAVVGDLNGEELAIDLLEGKVLKLGEAYRPSD